MQGQFCLSQRRLSLSLMKPCYQQRGDIHATQTEITMHSVQHVCMDKPVGEGDSKSAAPRVTRLVYKSYLCLTGAQHKQSWEAFQLHYGGDAAAFAEN